MNHRDLLRWKYCTLLILLGASLVACAEHASRGKLGAAQSVPPEYWWVGNPCGYLKVQKPLFNVSGWWTGPTKANVTVDVYIVYIKV